MNLRKPMLPCLLAAASAVACLLSPVPAALAVGTIPVTVGDDFFSPQHVTNSVGDSVQWTWQGAISHSSTGPGAPALWDSGIHGKGFVFTQKFSKAGTFAYRCVVHSFQTGSVVVQAALTSAPPAISIRSPAGGATFAAPWTGAISIASSDSDGVVTNIDLFAGSVLLASVANPSPSAVLNVTNLPPGTYNLKAIAEDNLGATNSSAVVVVSVVTPAPIALQSAARLSAGTFQFTYSTRPGLSYVIRRSLSLSSWTPVATNTASAAISTYLDPDATSPASFYSVLLVPNP